MKHSTQTVLMLFLGVAVGVMIINRSYLNYVKPSLLPFLILVVVVLIALASVSLIRDAREVGTETDDHDGHENHGHGDNGWLTWLLLAPIALIAFVVPQPIEAASAPPAMMTAEPQRLSFPPIPAERAPALSLPEVMMRANSAPDTIDNRLITVVGFTMRSSGYVHLARVMMICCAADAQLSRIRLDGPAVGLVAEYPEDTWLRVEGTVEPGSATAATQYVPSLSIVKVERIDRPGNPYAFS